MPAEVEEVVVDPDPLQAEDLGEDRAEDLLGRRRRAAAGRGRPCARVPAEPCGRACRWRSTAARRAPSPPRAPCSPGRRRATKPVTEATVPVALGVLGEHDVGHQPRSPASSRPATTAAWSTAGARRPRPRPRPVRRGSRGSSPGRRPGRGTRAARRRSTAPGRRCGTCREPSATNGSATKRPAVSPGRPR